MLETLIKRALGSDKELVEIKAGTGGFLAIFQAILAMFAECQGAPTDDLVKRVKKPHSRDRAALRNELRSTLEYERGLFKLRRKAKNIAVALEQTFADAEDEEVVEAIAEVRGDV